MDSFRFNLHSAIDVITNSSTETFTIPNAMAAEMVYDLIDHILKDARSSKKARDLYKVELKLCEEGIECEKERYSDDDIPSGVLEDIEKKNRYLTIEPLTQSSGEWFDNAEGKSTHKAVNGDKIIGLLKTIFTDEELER